MSPQLGAFGAWFNPSYDDARVCFVAEAEALGFGAAWLGSRGGSARRGRTPAARMPVAIVIKRDSP